VSALRNAAILVHSASTGATPTEDAKVGGVTFLHETGMKIMETRAILTEAM